MKFPFSHSSGPVANWPRRLFRVAAMGQRHDATGRRTALQGWGFQPRRRPPLRLRPQESDGAIAIAALIQDGLDREAVVCRSLKPAHPSSTHALLGKAAGSGKGGGSVLTFDTLAPRPSRTWEGDSVSQAGVSAGRSWARLPPVTCPTRRHPAPPELRLPPRRLSY